jgi:hypothetical protein
MDAKERWLVEQLMSVIKSGTFTERDILALLIVLRNHAKGDNVIREFGDFVAHREKDRGWLQKYVHEVKIGLANGDLPQNIPIANKHVQEDLNQVLILLKLPEVNEELANQITICIISLLQSVQVKIKEQKVTTLLKLHVGVGRDKIWLIGEAPNPGGMLFFFPIMFGQNRYLPGIDYDYPPKKMDQLVEAFSLNGRLRLEPRPQPA